MNKVILAAILFQVVIGLSVLGFIGWVVVKLLQHFGVF